MDSLKKGVEAKMDDMEAKMNDLEAKMERQNGIFEDRFDKVSIRNVY